MNISDIKGKITDMKDKVKEKLDEVTNKPNDTADAGDTTGTQATLKTDSDSDTSELLKDEDVQSPSEIEDENRVLHTPGGEMPNPDIKKKSA